VSGKELSSRIRRGETSSDLSEETGMLTSLIDKGATRLESNRSPPVGQPRLRKGRK